MPRKTVDKGGGIGGKKKKNIMGFGPLWRGRVWGVRDMLLTFREGQRGATKKKKKKKRKKKGDSFGEAFKKEENAGRKRKMINDKL